MERTAVLFIHGILGTPDHFTPFLPLIPPGWTVHNMLLKGHGGTVREFSAASMKEWKEQVHRALRKLRQENERVIIAAHSMGTLFAIQEAVEAPVDALFLLNVPLRIHVTPGLFSMIWKVFRDNINPEDPWAQAAKDAYGIKKDPNILHYIGWIPRYLELFSEIKKTRKIVHQLASKCEVYLSSRDELVSSSSGKAFEKNPRVTVTTLRTSGHFYYSPEDRWRLQKDFCKMIGRVLGQKNKESF